ncbi:MAG: hypothetical protein V3V67_07145 [Myxococcota bacterium]
MSGHFSTRSQHGFSYAEILLATLLLSVSLLPAVEALRSGLQGSQVNESLTLAQVRLRSKMEEVLAQPFSALAGAESAAAGAASAYSDAVGTPDRRLVFLARYDGDDADGDGDTATGTDPGLLHVRVEIAATPHAVSTLVAE